MLIFGITHPSAYFYYPFIFFILHFIIAFWETPHSHDLAAPVFLTGIGVAFPLPILSMAGH